MCGLYKRAFPESFPVKSEMDTRLYRLHSNQTLSETLWKIEFDWEMITHLFTRNHCE